MAKHFHGLCRCVLSACSRGTLASAAAEKRVALVIGNSAYQHTAQLKNPSNDATDMAAKLSAARLRGDRRHRSLQGGDGAAHQVPSPPSSTAPMSASSSMPATGLQVDGQELPRCRSTPSCRSDADLDFEAVELDLVLKQMERNSRSLNRVPRRLPRQSAGDAISPTTSRSLAGRPRPCAGREGRRHDDRLLHPARQRRP